jgi:uncharacterized membrane protein required for colicin V production
MGYRRGLTECIIKICSFVIAVVVAVLLFKPVSLLVIDNTQYDENIQTSIVQMFDAEEKKRTDENEEEEMESSDEKSGSPVYNYIVKEVKKSTEEKKNEIVQKIAREIAMNIINVLVFISLFILVRIALIFVKVLSNFVTNLPLIKQCDKMGGIVYGLLQAFVIVFIGLALITFISTIVGQNALLDVINQSVLGSILSNNNLLIQIIF